MHRISRHASYANVAATLALVFSLAGGAVAFTHLGRNSVGSKQLRHHAVHHPDLAANAVTSSNVRNRSLKGVDIDIATLPTVPAATASALLNGRTASQIQAAAVAQAHLRCPVGTRAYGGECIESAARPAANWDVAADTCLLIGRHLPAPDQLARLHQILRITRGNEWTNTAVSSFDALVSGDTGSFSAQPFAALFAYRCIAIPIN